MNKELSSYYVKFLNDKASSMIYHLKILKTNVDAFWTKKKRTESLILDVRETEIMRLR